MSRWYRQIEFPESESDSSEEDSESETNCSEDNEVECIRKELSCQFIFENLADKQKLWNRYYADVKDTRVIKVRFSCGKNFDQCFHYEENKELKT